MAGWMSFFANYKLYVEYKPGRMHFIADALSRWPNLDPTRSIKSEVLPTVAALSVSVPSSTLRYDVRNAYPVDEELLLDGSLCGSIPATYVEFSGYIPFLF